MAAGTKSQLQRQEGGERERVGEGGRRRRVIVKARMNEAMASVSGSEYNKVLLLLLSRRNSIQWASLRMNGRAVYRL